MKGTVATGEAARRLGITPQAVRDRIRAGTLSGRRQGRAWRVDSASLPDATAEPRSDAKLNTVLRRLGRLEEHIEAVAAALKSSDAARVLLERERDRYRADAAAAREAALLLTGVTRDAVSASRQLLEALERQTDAIGQLVAPSSPQDLLP